jgi:GTP cyclohydrolase IB
VNPLEVLALNDVQAQADTRGLPIDHVGIEDLDYPVTILDRRIRHQTVASVALGVALPATARGTHMSRFVETLDEHRQHLSGAHLPAVLADLLARLDADAGEITLRFPLFLEREAPASGRSSLMGYEGHLAVRAANGITESRAGVRVAVTSLCPCSKEISDYGAHNQRGHIEIDVLRRDQRAIGEPIWLADLIDVAEAAASAPLYPLLKRADERHVTMLAYDNPVFVEDIVRNAALALQDDSRVSEFRVKATNLESIHNHNATATITWTRPA